MRSLREFANYREEQNENIRRTDRHTEKRTDEQTDTRALPAQVILWPHGWKVTVAVFSQHIMQSTPAASARFTAGWVFFWMGAALRDRYDNSKWKSENTWNHEMTNHTNKLWKKPKQTNKQIKPGKYVSYQNLTENTKSSLHRRSGRETKAV